MTPSALVQRIRKIFSGSTFLTHVMALSGGTVVVQVVSFIVAPITSRLYHPGDFGLLAIFTACFSILSIIATMRYEAAIPIAKDDTEGVHLLLLAFFIAGFVTVFSVIISVAAGKKLSLLLTSDVRFFQYLWFLPVGVFATTTFNILSAWATRKQAFAQISVAKVMQSLLGSGCTVSLGLLNAGVLGLIVGMLVSSISGLRTLFMIAIGDIRKQTARIRWDGVLQAARSHYRFPLYNTWILLVNTLSIQLPVFILTSGFGATYTGYFSLCQRMLLLPTVLISGAITPVFYSRAKQAHIDGTLTLFTHRVLQSIAGINAFFVMFVAFFGEPLFTIAFGSNWTRSGTYAAALAPWLLFNFLVTPLATLPLVFGRQRTDLFFHASLLAVRAGSLLIGVYFGSDLVSVTAFGWGSAIFMLIYMSWLLRMVSVRIMPLLLRVLRELLIAAALIGCCRLVLWWSGNNFLMTGLVLVPVLIFAGLRTLRQIEHTRTTMHEA